jgi:hypothetical protein
MTEPNTYISLSIAIITLCYIFLTAITFLIYLRIKRIETIIKFLRKMAWKNRR